MAVSIASVARSFPVAAVVVAALASGILVGCSKPPAAEDPVRAVKVQTVGASAYGTAPEFSAEVRARIETPMGFRVAGKILRRQAELGQRVQAGQVLAQLDPQDYRLAADAARAQQASAQTNRDLAAADLKRYRELRAQNFISGAELERRETTLKSAQAQLEQAQSQFSVQGNQANYASLVADVSGVVTAIEAEPGQVVTAGTPVVRIAADGVRDVVFSVAEDKVASMKPGSAVKIRVWSQSTEFAGKVREVAASSDPITRTYTVKVSVDSKEPPPLGATVSVVPEAGSIAGMPVIKLPTTALRQEGKSTAVWVVDKATMTVKPQVIQVATADGNEVVVGSGLQPGMLVVSAGVHVLSPGQKVTLYQPSVALAGATPVQAAGMSSVSAGAAQAPASAASGTK